jgi:uncharacterized protein
VPQNYAEAVKWLRKAADQGNAHAQYNLGYMYQDGQGVPQNYVQAHMWFNLAAGHSPPGDVRDQAVKFRDILAANMTSAQMAEAQRLAQVCIQNKYKQCGVGELEKQSLPSGFR